MAGLTDYRGNPIGQFDASEINVAPIRGLSSRNAQDMFSELNKKIGSGSSGGSSGGSSEPTYNEQYSSLLGSHGCIVTADSLSGDDTLTTEALFPTRMRKGNNVSFWADITTFSSIEVCMGKGNAEANWFIINNTNVVLMRQSASSTATASTIAHGLTFTRFISVNVMVIDYGIAVLTIQTEQGQFKRSYNRGFIGNGAPKVVNVNSVLSNCKLSVSNQDFAKTLWFFGASYNGEATNRLTGQLINHGLGGWMQNSRTGANAPQNYEDFVKALNYGCPKYVVLGVHKGNSAYSSFSTAWNNFVNKCSEKNIQLVAILNPDHKDQASDMPRALIRATSGVKIIDLTFVQIEDAANGDHQWIEGYMQDDGVHMTELGAQAMAMKMLSDFPEIMEYKGNSNASESVESGTDDPGE